MTTSVCTGCLERNAEIARLRALCAEGAAALSAALDELERLRGETAWGETWQPDPAATDAALGA